MYICEESNEIFAIKLKLSEMPIMGYLKRLSKNDHNFSSISEYDK